MINLSINKKAVSVPEGTTILEAARQAGVNIPTLCYQKGLNDIGACRVCVVEASKNGVPLDRLVAACNMQAEEGLAVTTNSLRVIEARRTNVELLLSRHHSSCTSCERNGACALQSLASEMGVMEKRGADAYKNLAPKDAWDNKLPLQRRSSKCVQCLRCAQVCDHVQGLGVWDLVNQGSRIDVAPVSHWQDKCSYCGQCVTHCPVGALAARDDTSIVFEALRNPDITTVVQVAPAVRSAWAESLGLSRDEATAGKLAAALRTAGFDYVFDTDFAADLTIMEEGTEFIARKVKNVKHDKCDTMSPSDLIGGSAHDNFPMFTSCCPGWVRFIKHNYPDMVGCLSTAKSPQQMFGAVAKTYFAEKKGIDPNKLFLVSIMPCVAKKDEVTLPGMDGAGTGRDVDVVLTTREFARMLRAESIDIGALPEEAFDSPLGEASGAAVIFGATGGVMEAALRTVYAVVTGKNPPNPDIFSGVRGKADAPFTGVTSTEFEVAGKKVSVAVTSGLGNARRLIEAIRAGSVHYDFVEVMACPGGCAGGGGQPIALDREEAGERGKILWTLDKKAPIRYSHENPEVKTLYKDFLKEPCGEKSHHLLHVEHAAGC